MRNRQKQPMKRIKALFILLFLASCIPKEIPEEPPFPDNERPGMNITIDTTEIVVKNDTILL